MGATEVEEPWSTSRSLGRSRIHVKIRDGHFPNERTPLANLRLSYVAGVRAARWEKRVRPRGMPLSQAYRCFHSSVFWRSRSSRSAASCCSGRSVRVLAAFTALVRRERTGHGVQSVRLKVKLTRVFHVGRFPGRTRCRGGPGGRCPSGSPSRCRMRRGPGAATGCRRGPARAGQCPAPVRIGRGPCRRR